MVDILIFMANLLRNILHVLSDECVTPWVEQHRETPGISERDQMRFSRIVLDVQHTKQCNLLPCNMALVYAVS